MNDRQVRIYCLDQVSVRIKVRALSPSTEKTYVGWIKRFMDFHGRRDPAEMGREELDAFLVHLGSHLGLGAASINQAAAAVLFLYREVFKKDVRRIREMIRAKPAKTLPRYATPGEVASVIAHLPKVPRLAAMFMYGSGTRVAETMAIRVKDLNLLHRELTVRSGKGAKDRVVPIARCAVDAIRRQTESVARLHARDLESGAGWAQLPGALARRDPRAGWEVGGSSCFPAER